MPLTLSQVSESVHRLESVYTNWYLLAQGGRLTVLDAGLPGDWSDFTSALSRIGHTPADIDAVLITHHHRDQSVTRNTSACQGHGFSRTPRTRPTCAVRST